MACPEQVGHPNPDVAGLREEVRLMRDMVVGDLLERVRRLESLPEEEERERLPPP